MRVATFNLLHGVPLSGEAQEELARSAEGGQVRPGIRAGWRQKWPADWRDWQARAFAGSAALTLDAARVDSAEMGGAEIDADRILAGTSTGRDRVADPGAAISDGEAEREEIGLGVFGDPDATRALDPTRRLIWSKTGASADTLAAAIKELNELGQIDVMGIQEVDRHQPRSHGVDQIRVVAEAVGARYWRFAPSVRGTPGIPSEGAAWVPATEADDPPEDQSDPTEAPDDGPRYGIGIVSRWPVRAWRVRRFPAMPVMLPLMAPKLGRPRAVMVPDEPRAVVAAVIEMPYADVTVATAHLTFVPGYNAKQIRAIRAFLAGMPRPLILLGDFNTPGSIPGLASGWHQIARTPTYPVSRPRIQFDHILVEGWTADHVRAAQATVRAIPLPISDHCALVAELPDPGVPDAQS